MSKHTMLVTIPHGDPDLGAEMDVKITFEFRRGRPATPRSYAYGGDPPDPAEIEFLKAEPYCNGKPSPYDGSFADLEMANLQDLASSWLESDDGEHAALEQVSLDDEAGREFAAELRADRS